MGAEHTRERLIRTAERLMADRGIDGVSLRQIGAAAGERNTAAIQYHFGGKDGLIAAIFARRMAVIDPRRVEMLRDLEATGRTGDLRAVVGATVYPLAQFLLEDNAEGSSYLLFMAQAHRQSQYRMTEAAAQAGAVGLQRAIALIETCLGHLPAPVVHLRVALLTSYIIHALADHARLLRPDAVGDGTRDTALFVSNLVDTAVGLLQAPLSAATHAYAHAG